MSNHAKVLDHVTLISKIFLKFSLGIIEIWKRWKYYPLTPRISEFMVLLINVKLVRSTDILNTTSSLITSVSNNLCSYKFTRVCFLTHEIQKWHCHCLKTYWFWAIEKSYQNLLFNIRCGTIVSNFVFLNHNVSNIIKLMWWKNEFKFLI